MDIRGNPYGLLATHPLAPLVSLHHLNYLDPIFPNLTLTGSLKQLRTAYELDPDRALQHSFCLDLTRNWSISVSWGYTIQLYPSLLTAKDLEMTPLTFRSWRTWSKEPFTFNTRPVGSDPCRRPVVYFLDRAYDIGVGHQTLTTYRRHDGGGMGKECDRQDYVAARVIGQFNVSASKFNPDTWKKVRKKILCSREKILLVFSERKTMVK